LIVDFWAMVEIPFVVRVTAAAVLAALVMTWLVSLVW